MTTAILIAGLVVLVALAFVATRPEWRLPALAFAILALPGNVDNLVPQMTLDPHDLHDATAPAVSSIDLLLGWCVVLTLFERRTPGRLIGRLVLLALAVAAVAWVVAALAASRGVEPLAALRGAVLFARLPALLYLAGALRRELGDGSRLGLAVLAGGMVLLGNGVYTTLGQGFDRFTATTFGRNGLAIALTAVIVVAAGVAYRWWGSIREPGADRAARLVAPVAALLACGALFCAAATGTRMAFLVLIAVAGVGAAIYPGRRGWRMIRGIVVTVAVASLVLGASVVLTAAGARTVSVLTDPDAVDAVTEPGSVPTETEIRSRQQFWNLAIRMARDEPLTGVGPYQWNVERYVLDPKGPVTVADSHNAYLQLAAEYGMVVLVGYLALLAFALLTVAVRLRRWTTRSALGWAGVAIAAAAIVFPLADATNSHLFNVRNGAFEWLLVAAAVALAVAATEDETPRDPFRPTADARPRS